MSRYYDVTAAALYIMSTLYYVLCQLLLYDDDYYLLQL